MFSVRSQSTSNIFRRSLPLNRRCASRNCLLEVNPCLASSSTDDKVVRVAPPRSVGAFRPTPPNALWWGYKESDLHRLARERPWWENFALLMGSLAVVVVSGVGYYVGRRAWSVWRPAGNDLLVGQKIDELVFSHPDLAVALVHMALHHILSQTTTPFGAPMVAPPEYRAEATALAKFVFELNADQPQVSIPDLWVWLTSKALERLGGPAVGILRGREQPQVGASSLTLGSPTDSATVGVVQGSPDCLVKFTESKVKDNQRDVLQLRRVFASQKFSSEETVAAVGCLRTLGFHAAGKPSKPSLSRPMAVANAADPSNITEESRLTEEAATMRKCTPDPYVFGSEYFDFLLDYRWTPAPAAGGGPSTDGGAREGVDGGGGGSGRPWWSWIRLENAHSSSSSSSMTRGTTPFWVCNENDRARTELLVRPFSEEYLNTERLKSGMNAKELREFEAQHAAQLAEERARHSTLNPCEHITMESIDVALLDDAMTLGWLHKFSQNELRFYRATGKVFDRIFKFGYNENELYVSGVTKVHSVI